MRSDEMEVPTRIGDAPPFLPFRKPFDLNAWQLPLLVLTVALALNLEGLVSLSDEPFQKGALLSPMVAARFVVLAAGLMVIFVQPQRRLLPAWLWIALKHFYQALAAVYGDDGDERGPTYFPADAEAMTRMKLEGTSAIFVVAPPLWGLVQHIPPMRDGYWARRAPYRLMLPVEPQGELGLMTDQERAGRWHALGQGLRALRYPVQIVSQARAEDPAWLAVRAMPPPDSPFASLSRAIGAWAGQRAADLMYRRVVVTCSAPSVPELVEHVRDVHNALTEAGLQVRETRIAEQRGMFTQVFGLRRFFPHPITSFGIDGTNWVTLEVLDFPRHCVVGWVNFIAGDLPIDVALYAEPDDGAWVTRLMEMFDGMAGLPTADTDHLDARNDLMRVEGKLKRNEDCVLRTTLLLTMPEQYAPRVSNRLRKAGAIYREARFEHQGGRLATLPVGGSPSVGLTRPLDGESVAGAYPFGAAGLRTDGVLLGTARTAREAVTVDLRDPILHASMVVILGTTGAGKTVLMEMLLLRSGLPFVVIDMKPHLDETRHGDFYPLVEAARGNYHVCVAGEPLPVPHPFAQAYNLATVKDADKPAVLQAIAEQEWARAVECLEDRIFAMDEAYWLGRTAAGQEFIERVVSQGRSVGFIGICASQEVGDFLGNQRLAKAVTMSSVQFVLAQEFSQVDHVADALRLGGQARDELRKFQPNPGDDGPVTRSAIMRVGQRMVSFRIEVSPEEMALYTTKPADKRAARAEREEVMAA